MSLATRPWPDSTRCTISSRSKISRIAWRTRTSSNGAWSTAIVIVSQLPASDSSSARLELRLDRAHLGERDVDGGVDLAGR